MLVRDLRVPDEPPEDFRRAAAQLRRACVLLPVIAAVVFFLVALGPSWGTAC
jgi:hypothetical protein